MFLRVFFFISDDKNDDKPRNQPFKTKQKAHCCRLSVRYILKLKHFVVEFNDKCFVDFWVDFIAFWQASQ